MKFAVVGDPISHSKSPAMHAAVFRALGLQHTYEAIRAAADDLPRIVAMLRAGTYAGLNVTVPHKAFVLDFVDDLDASANSTGAANTLVRAADGGIVAHNTDAPALARELCDLAPDRDWAGTRALVLGSGGAARAAVAALGALGVSDVVVRARSRPNWRPSPEVEATVRTVVQATTAGMSGAAPGDAVAAVVAWDALPEDAVALDVVYSPADTPLLHAARARGLRASNGLGMLARQGALALHLWLGIDAPLDVMRAAIAPR